MNPTVLNSLTDLCFKKGIKRFVICPGSRSAALSLSLAEHPEIEKVVCADERSAAYIALGMAVESGECVGLVCTSGTAAINFAPAIAEAYFQRVPLLVLTADRPEAVIGQNEGQSVHQQDLYGKNCLKAYHLRAEFSDNLNIWFANRVFNEGINLALERKGPVHINLAFEQKYLYDQPLADNEQIKLAAKMVSLTKGSNVLTKGQMLHFQQVWEKAERKLILVGNMPYDEELNNMLKALAEYDDCVIASPVTGNLHRSGAGLSSGDNLFTASLFEDTSLIPDLIITIGGGYISSKIRKAFEFLGSRNSIQHWHLATKSDIIDPLTTVTEVINTSAVEFIKRLGENAFFRNPDLKSEFSTRLKAMDEAYYQTLENDQTCLELEAVKSVLNLIPEGSVLHLSNSMSVRYANDYGIEPGKAITVHCNRGTSGIDGCLSTAVGAALASDKNVYLIIGDLAYFYDLNGLWVNNLPKNLKIILLNNSGGIIFRAVVESAKANDAELVTYFQTPHQRRASDGYLPEGARLKTYEIQELKDLSAFEAWMQNSSSVENCQIAELIFEPEQSVSAYKNLKAKLNQATKLNK